MIRNSQLDLKIILYTILLTFLALTNPAFGQSSAHIKLDSINSGYDEQNPVMTPDGKRLYFVRAGHPQNIAGVLDRGDIWYSDKTEQGWSTPQHGGNVLNHNGLNGIVGFSVDGQRVYLLNYKDDEGRVSGGIAMAEWVRDHWSVPQSVDIQYFSNNSQYLSGTISPDEKVMILSYRSFDTYGNEDLYVTLKKMDGSWSQPENLGIDINTMSEEWAPYLTPDLKSLYFSSNGFGGEGGRDIFVSQRKGTLWDDWTSPVNLGNAVNTAGVELGYIVPSGGGLAYFSTTQNSEGFGDIVAFPLNETEQLLQEVAASAEVPTEAIQTEPAKPNKPMVVMTMQVLDIRNDEPIDAIVKLTYGEKEIDVNTANVDSPAKKFLVSVEEGKEVNVEISSKGFLIYKEQFMASAKPSSNDEEFKVVEGFRLTPREVGTKVKIDNVLFNEGKSTFSNPSSTAVQLDKLIQLMETNPELEIRLEGHTDNRGNPKLLKELSLERVGTVKKYLVNKGVAGNRIETLGLGSENPVGRNSSNAGRELNRRVEFVIIK